MVPSSFVVNVPMHDEWIFSWRMKIRVKPLGLGLSTWAGLAISRLSWDFGNREWFKNNLRGITSEMRLMWGINSLTLDLQASSWLMINQPSIVHYFIKLYIMTLYFGESHKEQKWPNLWVKSKWINSVSCRGYRASTRKMAYNKNMNSERKSCCEKGELGTIKHNSK